MTPAALLAAFGRLHLTPPEAARLLGYNKTSVYRWIRGDATVPPCVERVLWGVEHYPGFGSELALWPQQDVKP